MSKPEFLLDWNRSEVGRRRPGPSAAGATVFHLLALLGLLSVPPGMPLVEDGPLLARSYDRTPLVAPPAPVRRPEPILAPAPVTVPLPAPIPVPQAPPPEPEPQPAVEPPAAPAPQPEVATAPEPPPEAAAAEPKPVIAFEKPGAITPPSTGSLSSGVAATPRIQVPVASVESAIRRLAQEGTGRGTVIGDVEVGGGDTGIVEARGLPPSPGRTGSSLTILSDTKGVDFRPYLVQILATVRRNWYVVMPASARLGRRGRVLIQLAIDRDGNIPKLVIASSSGAEPLDRAAVAGLTASEPFPPLPSEFTGDEVRIQFNFLYGAKRR